MRAFECSSWRASWVTPSGCCAAASSSRICATTATESSVCSSASDGARSARSSFSAFAGDMVASGEADQLRGVRRDHLAHRGLGVAEVEDGLDHVAEAVDEARVADLAEVGAEDRAFDGAGLDHPVELGRVVELEL